MLNDVPHHQEYQDNAHDYKGSQFNIALTARFLSLVAQRDCQLLVGPFHGGFLDNVSIIGANLTNRARAVARQMKGA
jgi:hypothetical protein